jgi:hypothetical protein
MPEKTSSYFSFVRGMAYKRGSSKQYSQQRSRVKAAVAEKLKKARQLPLLPSKPKIINIPVWPSQNQPMGLREGTLERDASGFYARFPSKSSPSSPPYTTRIWTVHSGRFNPGDVSCNCKGWIYNHHCHHTDDIKRLYEGAGFPSLGIS